MSSVACLRIMVPEALTPAETEALAPLVAKVAGAFLETTWLWPRRFGLVAPFAFVLADPRAVRLDAREMQALAAALQAKLFGAETAGEICLLMLEGDQTEVMRFAGAHRRELQALLDGSDDGAFVGRVCRVTPDGVVSIVPPGGPVDGAPPAELLNVIPAPPPPARGFGWWGIYQLTRGVFVGSGVETAERRGGRLTETDDPFTLDRDLLGVKALGEALAATPTGFLFMNFSFSNLVRPSARSALKPILEALPQGHRGRLAVTIRQTPREPSYSALAQMLRLLQPHVGAVNLRTGDPDFRLDAIPAGSINSVTLALSGTDQKARLLAIRRFMNNQSYRPSGVWQGLTAISNARELELCRLMHAPFVSGPAVTELLRTPVGKLAVRYEDLPYPVGQAVKPARSEAG